MKSLSPALNRLVVFFGAWIFFLIYLQYPEKRNFDEFHYIPSALQWLGLKVNQNWEHPPLAKQLISLGLWIFGDVGIGWRFASTLFGAITLLAVFLSSEILFKSVKWAWITSFLTLFNFLLYVQSRIAMLDTFMMAFLALSFWAALKAYEKNEPEPEFRFLNLAGLFMGLAVACKWFSFIPYGIAGAMMAYHFFQAPTRMRFLKYVIAWIGVPVLAYYVTYIPYLWIDRTPPFSVLELLGRFQLSMWHGQKSVGGTHPYQSVWWSWPLMTRPIWYAYDAQGELKQTIRGVLLLGNPLIMWGGLVAVVSSVIAWVRKYNRVDTVLLALYFGMLLSWAVIPRKLTFYYYYYPNGILLSYFVTRWLKTINRDWVTSLVMGLTFGLFVYFFPILSAMPIPAGSFLKWMWLRTWI